MSSPFYRHTVDDGRLSIFTSDDDHVLIACNKGHYWLLKADESGYEGGGHGGGKSPPPGGPSDAGPTEPGPPKKQRKPKADKTDRGTKTGYALASPLTDIRHRFGENALMAMGLGTEKKPKASAAKTTPAKKAVAKKTVAAKKAVPAKAFGYGRLDNPPRKRAVTPRPSSKATSPRTGT